MAEKKAEAVRAPAAASTAGRTRTSAPLPVLANPLHYVGNRGFGKLLASGSITSQRNTAIARPRSPIIGMTPAETRFDGVPIQRKCAECEREVANSTIVDTRPQRKCASCEEEEQQLQRKSTGGESTNAPPNVRDVLRSPGRQLDPGTREFMESRFGHDFGRVQIHLDATAAASARALKAQAYTVGEHVVFGANRYTPATEAGRGLIAHELTHVVQQQNGFRAESGAVADTAEQEALTNERIISSGRPLSFSASPSALAKRDETEFTAPTAAPGCTVDQAHKIEPAARLAIQWLDRSIDLLSRFIVAPASRENQSVAEALQRHFGSTDPAIAGRVIQRITIVRHDIDSARAGTELVSQCQDKHDSTCEFADAYVPEDMSSLNFCPDFFKRDLDLRAETIIHEMTHSIVGDITDRGYSSDRIMVPVNGHNILSTAEQLTNAESYAWLVQELGTGKVPKSTAPTDSFESECREIEPLLKVAMARAQRWNRAGETRAKTDVGGSVIQQQLGSDTPQLRQAAYDFYHQTASGLNQSFDFKCDRDCGARLAYGQTAADNLVKGLGLGMAIGTGVGAIAGAIAGAFLGSVGGGALLGGLIGLAVGYFAGLIAGIATSHGPRIHVCPRWKNQSEPARIESILTAAYEALGKSQTDSLKYAQLAGAMSQQLFPVPTMEQIDRTLTERRLSQIQARLETLRKRYRDSSDAFANSVTDERMAESLKQGTKDLNKEIRSDSANKDLWGGSFASKSIRSGATAAVSGKIATVTVNLQITYLALSDTDGETRAKQDVPRIEQAMRDVWQVDIAHDEYAGMTFRLVPSITYLHKGRSRAANAFLIQVRGADKDPSSGDSVHGTISLAQAHLVGPRVIVVAHELAHLFGFVDTYLTMTKKEKGGKTSEQMNVGRSDPANRPDLLGMIDPVVLERERKKGAVTAQEVAKQTGQIRVWEEEAITVLRTLGVAPLERPRPTPESENFDQRVELDRIAAQGDSKLARIRKQRERIDDSMKSLDLAEEILRLEAEEKTLKTQLSSP